VTKDESSKTPKRGAPKKAENLKRKKSIPLMMTEAEKARFTEFAETRGWSMSTFLRTAADEFMKNHPE
jgi:hypothetical protein